MAPRSGRARLGLLVPALLAAASAALAGPLPAQPAGPDPEGLSLSGARELARRNSEALRIQAAMVAKSRLAQREAGARAWPRLDLQASVSYLTDPPEGVVLKAGDLGRFQIPPAPPVPLPAEDVVLVEGALPTYFSLTASLSQPLLTWGKIRGAIDLAALQADAAGCELLARRRSIDREVHRAYFAALLARESEAVLARMRDTAAAIVGDRQNSFEQGAVTREAVLEAQADLAAVEARLAEAGQRRASALESLGLLTGLDPASITLATGFRAALPALDEEAIRAKALAGSTDLSAARTRERQARKRLQIARGGAALRPDLSLGVSFDLNGQDIPFRESGWMDTWDWDLILSLGVKVTAFDGPASRSRIGQAEKDLEAAGAGVGQAAKLARLGARRAVEAAIIADAAVKEKEARAAHAEEKGRNARAAFENGMASREDCHGAELLAGSAKLDLLRALHTREEALADVEQLLDERLGS